MMHTSWSRQLLTISSILTISIAINRPVYKIVLNSKGYAQFIQYEVDLPSLRELTLCVWVRVTSLESDQTIFTYIGNDDKRVMRLWLDSGGQQLWISLDHERVVTSTKVEFSTGVWRDVCLSYQADLGAWALYLDAKLISCEGSRNLQGFEFPGQGSLIFGYGTSEKGSPTGLTGEIYGASMILYSTIERDSNMRKESLNRQRIYLDNKMQTKIKQTNKYIVLGDLQTDEIQTVIPLSINNELRQYHPHRTVQQAGHNIKMFSGLSALPDVFNNKNINDFSIDVFHNSVGKDMHPYKHFNTKPKDAVIKGQRELKKELTGSSTRDLPIVLEYETPPPILAPIVDYFAQNSEKNDKSVNKNQDNVIMLSDVEKPPPPEHDSKVYGQWTSSKFVSNVLNYLKSINFNAKKQQKKVPSTKPVIKLSDSYPYQSEFIYTKIRPPINYMKKIHTENRYKIKKRDVNSKQINVQIIKNGERDTSELLTKQLDPKFVEVTNRGEAKHHSVRESFKNLENNTPIESIEPSDVSQNLNKNLKLNSTSNILERHRGSSVMNILPFIKSKKYFSTNRKNQAENIESYQDYSNSLSNDKKWHHVKSNNNDDTHQLNTDEKSQVSVASKNQPIRIQHKPGWIQQLQGSNDASITYGRALAKEVSDQAKQDIYHIPLLKYKHRFSLANDPKIISRNNVAIKLLDDGDYAAKNNQNHFNQHVKLGNALNEQFILGNDEHQIKNTFLGGDDKIPDINRHRSKWDTKTDDIPSSLGARACKNIELYVKEDESIGKSKILSPIHRTNLAIEFIEQSYKKCSMEESSFKDSSLLVIDWTKTPVKLFGGAYPKQTTDLCGFF